MAAADEVDYHELLDYIFEHDDAKHLQTRDKHEIEFLLDSCSAEEEWKPVAQMSKIMKRQIALYYYVVMSNWQTAIVNIKAYDTRRVNLPGLIQEKSFFLFLKSDN